MTQSSAEYIAQYSEIFYIRTHVLTNLHFAFNAVATPISEMPVKYIHLYITHSIKDIQY